MRPYSDRIQWTVPTGVLCWSFLALFSAAFTLAQVQIQRRVADPEVEATALGKPDEETEDSKRAFTYNTRSGVENDLKIARNLADAGGYPEASARYVGAVDSHPDALVRAEGKLYMPLWRFVVQDVLSWPEEGLKAYRAEVNGVAREAYLAALRQRDIVGLERVAQQFFLSESGDDAAVALADRLREEGYPALALFYYRLVLTQHPDSDIPRDDLLIRAALSARTMGLATWAERITPELQSRTVRPDVEGPAVLASDWLSRMAVQEPASGDLSAGLGETTDAPAVTPATVIWETPLAKIDQQMRQRLQILRNNATSFVSTSRVYPCVDGDTLYLTNSFAAWAIDVRSGSIKWTFDSRGEQKDLPPPGMIQGRQPLLCDGVLYVPVEQAPSNDGNQANMFNPYGIRAAATNLCALDAESGKLLWDWNPRTAGLDFAELSIDGRPAVSGDTVVVTLGSHGGLSCEAYTAALDRKTGRLLWSQSLVGFDNDIAVTEQQSWRPPQKESVSSALAIRGGIVFFSSLGFTAAQALPTGHLLWARQMEDVRCGAAEASEQTGRQKLVDGMVVDRLPRVLADRGLVITGAIVSPDIEAYDWLDGRLAWRATETGARYPLAILGDRVIAWGTGVIALGLADGEPVWPLQTPTEAITGEPIIADDNKVLVPTAKGIATIDAAAGTLAGQVALPIDFDPGNLALTENGLVVVSDLSAASFLDWSTAKSRYLAMADENPADPGPLVALGAAALRLRLVEEGLDYLDGALARDPQGDLQRKLYYLYENFYRASQFNARDDLIVRILDRMQSSAGSEETFCRQSFLRAEYLAMRNPAAALATLQSILDRPETRHILLKSNTNPAGPGVSGVLAEEAIGRLIDAFGRGVYDDLEGQARRAMDRAPDYDALLEVACRYPNSATARESLDRALGLAMEREDLNEANRLLVRLINLTPEGSRETRYRSLAAQTSQRLGRSETACFQAAALLKTTAPDTAIARLDGSATTVADLARDIHPTPPAPGQATGVPVPPYRVAWTIAPTGDMGALRPVGAFSPFSGMPDEDGDEISDAEQPLYLASHLYLVAVNRKTGDVIWKHKAEFDPQRGRQTRFFRSGSGLFAAFIGEVASIDPTTGEERWSIRLQPERRRQLLAPREALTAVLRYGDTGFSFGSNVMPNFVINVGENILVCTQYNAHLIDARDGYTIQTVGFPTGVFYGGFIHYGSKVMAIPVNQQHCNEILMWDMATGDLEKVISLDERIQPSQLTPHGSRWWPILTQKGERVWILDLKTCSLGKPIEIPEELRQPLMQTRQVLADERMLIMAPYQSKVTAVSADDGKVIWTFDPPVSEAAAKRRGRGVTAMKALGDGRLLVAWNGGIAGVNLSDGKPAWTLTRPRWENVVVRHTLRDRVIVQASYRDGNNYRTRMLLIDTTSGRELYDFSNDDGVYVDVRPIDQNALFVVSSQNGEMQYWVHDDNGPLKPGTGPKPDEQEAPAENDDTTTTNE